MKVTLEFLISELTARGWAMDAIKPGDGLTNVIFEKSGFRWSFPMRDIPLYYLLDCLEKGPRTEVFEK